MSKLLIVESPAKARTIGKYLGKDFKVKASVGHVVDLPRKELGVDTEHDFEPKYEVMPEKKKAVADLRAAAKTVDEIYLAPDPDREGEAIAWHIANLLKKSGKPMRRVLINEITKPAVIKALENSTEIDQDRFEAQQARRILDRLVGYKISPIISKKFRAGLSAGRVQSVALRLVVERERAIRAFNPQEYWSIEAAVEGKQPPPFTAKLAAVKGKTLETPGDRFDPAKNAVVAGEDQAKAIVEAVSGKPFVVGDINRQERKRNPSAPFITSTLQQDAARKLGFTAKKTMAVAQQLYEGLDVGEGAVGLVTYMRTDSPRVSSEALDMVRGYIANKFGKNFLPGQPRIYKSGKSAQDAHEAIRPTSMERTPEAVKEFLTREQYRLYELIFLRFVASQMEAAVYDQTTMEIPVGDYLFRASGRILKFKGFLALYEEATDDEPESQDESLPMLAKGDELKVNSLTPEQHFTKPPPRFTEASLVKELEEKGIGRPSTYAQILSTIVERKYVEKDQRRFAPTPLGEMINDILVQAFPDVVDISFTAQMEEDLDKVEEGRENWIALLRRFYTPFSERLANAGKIIDEMRQDEPTDIHCPLCQRELVVRWSRKGEFLGCSGYPECNYTTDFERDENRNIKPVERVAPLSIVCPRCAKPLQIRQSRRGEFLGCTGYPDCTFTSDFAQDEEGNVSIVEREPDLETGIVCDQCGAPMVIRKTRRGGKEFLACTAYPKCRNARDFKRTESGQIEVLDKDASKETGIVCDQCGRPMMIKRTRRGGKEFLACSGYPECKNAKDFIREEDGTVRVVEVGEKGEACDKCGKPMVLKRGRFGTFWACSGYPDCKNIKTSQGEEEKAPDANGSAKAAPGPAQGLPDEPPCEKCGRPMVQRVGRFGPFIACSGYPECKNIRKKNKKATVKKAPKKAAKKSGGKSSDKE